MRPPKDQKTEELQFVVILKRVQEEEKALCVKVQALVALLAVLHSL